MVWSWLLSLVPPPEARRPLTLSSFTQDFLPPFILYFATAVLVILPRTYAIRLALFPISLAATFRAATQLDLSKGWGDDEYFLYLNQGLILTMCTVAMRLCIWTFQQEPFYRTDKPKESTPSAKRIFMDACHLFSSLRGIGWNWSEGLQLPPEDRPLQRLPFLGHAVFGVLKHAVTFDFLHYAIQSFDPETIGSPSGGTIFDPSLPPLLRYLRSTAITFFGGLAIANGIQLLYHFFTALSLILLHDDPAQWPPLFMKPWMSTSLTRLWARDWHQLFRDNFFTFGGRTFAKLTGTGRIGVVVGAFLVSGLLHDWALWGMGRGTDFKRVAGFFLMMGVGIILEGLWRRVITGKKVEGFYGWIWTMCWVMLWGNGLLEAWSSRGLIGSRFCPDSIRPSVLVVGMIREAMGA